ncbi:hypothetical protein TREMEDRAFT_60680 [Tremella mesenterica DSM 1558]|uniref:uncharacterized protein n=1 Tax=Tremella mesenterica (strain ATCC 24925 / CBS 8224 / DSM 1558 / NBRC 9311 / NRRL Y-6157 / RJB 2259-6 / UBC 559-6) TaxID=578456 RepID=UPI0003F4A26F|nr:uncharacterized protein TREMEDRAFT_60680 [Tremella mesenterica DSM 1558]EIW71766.1 hypothetical protein TREMEDRAFT_60680 [Tremella mesenterica DSM 1558]
MSSIKDLSMYLDFTDGDRISQQCSSVVPTMVSDAGRAAASAELSRRFMVDGAYFTDIRFGPHLTWDESLTHWARQMHTIPGIWSQWELKSLDSGGCSGSFKTNDQYWIASMIPKLGETSGTSLFHQGCIRSVMRGERKFWINIPASKRDGRL